MADDMTPQPAEDDVAEDGEKPGLIDRLRGMGVGTEDPNLVGDAGPYDVAPGGDPPAGAIGEDE